jgi:hypothetical protein
MIVVLPVCAKDSEAALRNLAWIEHLDGRNSYACIVSHDANYDATAVLAAARLCFASVTEFVYLPPRNTAWPMAANWAWQHAAAHIRREIHQPWLWWEQDAVPLRARWLDAIVSAYSTCGRSFMGTAHSSASETHLNGVSVYPSDVITLHPDMALANHIPFDIAGGKPVLDQSAISNLFQHVWSFSGNKSDSPPPSFEAHDNLNRIRADAVLFHRCKDATLIEALRRQPIHKSIEINVGSAQSTIEASPVSDVTVVITNFQRPEMLLAAYNSCKLAHVAHIVITSSGITKAVRSVLDRIELDPSVTVTARSDDAGCNENWIRGAALVKTSRLTILHDDDLLLPAYEAVVAGKFSADIIHWNGAKHNPAGSFPGIYVTCGTLPDGVYPITFLLQFLLNPNANTLSPVSGCFPTSHVLSTLEECEKNFGPWAYLRPTMMVGNDLLLWLRACQNYRTFYYSQTPFISYGHHSGSASFDDASYHRLKLLPIYKATRDYYVRSTPHLIHVINRFIPSDPSNLSRIHGAAISWDIGYHYEFIHPCHQWAWHRDSTSIGEPTGTPFLRDLLQRGLDSATTPNDMIVLTNDDTIINQYFWFAAMDKLRECGAGCSFRRNVSATDLVNCWAYPSNPIGTRHCGRDAFFFTQDWLREHLMDIPDYIVGFCDWDSTLAMLIRLTNGHVSTAPEFSEEHPSSELPSRYIYHIDHSARWAETFDHPGNRYSRSLTDDFFKRHLGWPMPKLRNGKW